MLNHNLVFKNSDLSAISNLANQHLAVNCLTTGKEFCFGNDCSAATSEIARLTVITIATSTVIAVTAVIAVIAVIAVTTIISSAPIASIIAVITVATLGTSWAIFGAAWFANFNNGDDTIFIDSLTRCDSFTACAATATAMCRSDLFALILVGDVARVFILAIGIIDIK
jgi:hypothetical protein